MNLSEAKEVLAYPNFFWPQGSVFRMFARGQGRVFGYICDTPTQLADATTWCDNNGFNSYWQINPTRRRDGTRCSEGDITHWCFLPFDIDPVCDGAIPLLALHDFEDRLVSHMPEDFKINRLILDSGRGVQALYPCAPLELTPSGRYGISQFMSRLMHKLLKDVGEVHGCVLDTSCSDLPRVMRMPYTINTKTGKRASFIAKTQDIAIHSLPALPAPDPHMEVLEIGEGHDWIDYFPHLTVTARKFIQEGHSEPGRHKAAAATMLSLQERGADKRITMDALLTGNAMSPEPLHPREIVTMVDRRFRKALTTG